MAIHLRPYLSDDDYWQVRTFLQRIRTAQTRPGVNWQTCDFDYWRWHWMANVVERPLHELLLWENDESRLVAALIQGDPGVCHVQMDPGVRSPSLIHALLEEGERRYCAKNREGRYALFVWADTEDGMLQQALGQRGYVRHQSPHAKETTGWQFLTEPLPEAITPQGVALRSMNDTTDLPARSLCSWRAFHPGEPDAGADPTGSWYRSIQHSPSYRHDLDVVAVAEDGDIVSFATFYFDVVSRSGVLVLAGTSPLYRRQGIGKATVIEGLHRLKALGGIEASVSWYDEIAGTLYESAGFTNQAVATVWKKQFD